MCNMLTKPLAVCNLGGRNATNIACELFFPFAKYRYCCKVKIKRAPLSPITLSWHLFVAALRLVPPHVALTTPWGCIVDTRAR